MRSKCWAKYKDRVSGPSGGFPVRNVRTRVLTLGGRCRRGRCAGHDRSQQQRRCGGRARRRCDREQHQDRLHLLEDRRGRIHLPNADKGCQARIDRQNADGWREQAEDRGGHGRRPVVGGQQDGGAGPGAEQARVHGREQFLLPVLQPTSTSRTPRSRRSTAATTARTTAIPGNEDIISALGQRRRRRRCHLRQDRSS